MVTTAYAPGQEIESGGTLIRVREDGETFECARCNGVRKNGDPFTTLAAVQLHWNRWCDLNPKQELASAKQSVNSRKVARRNMNDQVGVETRSRRGRRRLDMDKAPDPLSEVAKRPGGMRGGPAAYFIRPDGATISEALIVSPNGAPMMRNGRDRGNSRLYQDRMKDKDFEYIGPTLDAKGIRRLAEVIGKNRGDYILFLDEEIQLAEQSVRETESPDIREQQRRRLQQLQRQLAIASRPFEADQMITEMDDILKAMKLAALTPDIREAVSIMFDQEVQPKIAQLIGRLEHSTASTEDGMTVSITNAGEDEEF